MDSDLNAGQGLLTKAQQTILQEEVTIRNRKSGELQRGKMMKEYQSGTGKTGKTMDMRVSIIKSLSSLSNQERDWCVYELFNTLERL